MGFKGSPPYVQRQIDKFLRRCRKFARAYVDDIVVFSQTLEEHREHLREILTMFEEIGLCLSPKKSYIGYPSV
jgi:hypothetical protein